MRPGAEEYKDNVIIFSLDRSFILFANNTGKIGLYLSGVVGLTALISPEMYSMKALLTSMSCVALVPYLTGLVFRNYAYRIKIDFRQGAITFYMLRNRLPLTLPFQDIISIRRHGYIIIHIPGQTILYNDPGNEELLEILHTIRKAPPPPSPGPDGRHP